MKNKTKVFFKKSMTEGFENTVMAFFPDAKTNPDMILSYEHTGQHGEASIEFCRECIAASPKEYAELKNELEKLCGYNLQILKNGEHYVYLRVPSFHNDSSWVDNAQQHISCCNFVLQAAIC